MFEHVIVASAPGVFYGWPANNGIWSWGDEIVVGFLRGRYRRDETSHSLDRNAPHSFVQARSKDGGYSWQLEEPSFPLAEEPRPYPGGIDFTHPGFALKVTGNYMVKVLTDRFVISYDKATTWEGPYSLPTFEFQAPLTARTDYVVNGQDDCFLFLSIVEPEYTGKTDRAFCARTKDGGRTFEFVSWLTGPPDGVRSVMPATVRISERHLVSALRRRQGDACWIDVVASEDDGASWSFRSKVADTQRPGGKNGNPPSMVRLPDGRLCVTYGYRSEPYGIRAKISEDDGHTWGKEIILRDDAASWDMGYTRTVVRPDGRLVTVYYYTTSEIPEQHIAATIWDPGQ